MKNSNLDQYTYVVDNGGYHIPIDTDWLEDSADYIAEEAAEDYYDNRDGWEDKWPKIISIYKDSRLLGRFEVDIEYEPTFSASKIEQEEE